MVFTVGESTAKHDWPFIHPGPQDNWAGEKQHKFVIQFGLKSVAESGDCQLDVRLIDTHSQAPPRLRIAVNGKTFEESLPRGGGDETAIDRPEQGKRHRIAIKFPVGDLQAGSNEISITTLSGSWILYDSLALTAPAGTQLAKYDFSTSTTKLAKPSVGTAGTGHTFPGACVPFGMVQLSPDTRTQGWAACAGYQAEDARILGFSHNHLSGTGFADLGNILMMPAVGSVDLGSAGRGESGFPQTFAHGSETMSPGYYHVTFPESKITVELTATTRAGLHRYTFPASDQAHVCFDLHHGMANDVRECELQVENDHVISGYRKYNGWGGSMQFFFVAEFSKPFKNVTAEVGSNQSLDDVKELKARSIRARVDFATTEGEKVLVKVGLSAVSVEGARKNLMAEIPNFDFDKTRAEAEKAWQDVLGRIEARAADRKTLEIFYSACLSRLPGAQYLLRRGRRVFRAGRQDARRTRLQLLHDALAVGHVPRRKPAALRDSAAAHGRCRQDDAHALRAHVAALPAGVGQRGPRELVHDRLPLDLHDRRRLSQGPSRLRRGIGLEGDDRTMNRGRDRELAEYRTLGYVARNSPGRGNDRARLQKQCVSRTLELCYNDACIARFAEAIGKPELGAESRKRAQNYRNVYDPAVGFMRGKLVNGKWAEPFNPLQVNFDDFTEADAWHYLFFAPARCPGADRTLGRRAALRRPPRRHVQQPHGRPFGDTGPHRADRPVLPRQRTVPSHGLSLRLREPALEDPAARAAGDDRALRQHPRRPARATTTAGRFPRGTSGARWAFIRSIRRRANTSSAARRLDKATIHLDPKYATGKTFTIEARHNSPNNIYILSATLNGKPLTRNYITQEELTAGGELVLEMGPQPKFSRIVGGKSE